MKSSFLAFAWPLWGRNKAFYGIALIALLLVAILTHLVQGPIPKPSTPDFMGDFFSGMLPGLYGLISVAVAGTAIGLHPFGIRGIKYGNDSTYLRTWPGLPVKTQTLLWVPSLISGLIFSWLWIPFELTTVVPLGLNIPAWLPFLVGFACLAIHQAVWWGAGWIPFVAGLVPLPMFVVIYVAFTSLDHHPEPARSLVLLTIIAASMGFASWVAPKARQGAAPPPWPFAKKKREESLVVGPLEPFKSRSDAQFWYECGPRRMALLLPIGIVSFFVIFISCMMIHPAFLSAGPDFMLQPIGLWDVKADISFLIFAPYLPLLVGGMGPNSGVSGSMKGRHPSKPSPLESFGLVRPISSASIVGARLRLASISALAISPILILCGAMFLCERAVEGGTIGDLMRGDFHGPQGTLGQMIVAHLGGRAPWLALLGALCVPLLCFSLQGGNPFFDTKWRRLSLALVFGGIIAVLGVNMLMISRRIYPHYGDDALQALYVFAWVWLVAKLALSGYAALRLVRQRLLSAGTLQGLAGAWVALLLALTAAFFFALPRGIIALPTLVLTIAILLPANRFLWLVLNLDSVRHAT